MNRAQRKQILHNDSDHDLSSFLIIITGFSASGIMWNQTLHDVYRLTIYN